MVSRASGRLGVGIMPSTCPNHIIVSYDLLLETLWGWSDVHSECDSHRSACFSFDLVILFNLFPLDLVTFCSAPDTGLQAPGTDGHHFPLE